MDKTDTKIQMQMIKEAVVELILNQYVEVDDHKSIGLFPNAQLINGKWMKPRWGCDTMQHLIDELKGDN
jgi:hypothetical protein